MWPLSRAWRRQRLIGRHPLDPAQWSRVLEAPLFVGLDDDERARLHDLCVVLLHEKSFEGCGGLVLDGAMRLQIAAQACLPVLELGIDAYSAFRTVLVYPREFRARVELDAEDGTVVEAESRQLGESWEGGPVILSWADVAASDDGFHLVIHEFAHKLDELSGEADGVPPDHPGFDSDAWRRDFASAAGDLARQEELGLVPVIDPYAADDPAEAFAVFSEHFFGTPRALSLEFPAVYEHLRRFYRQDPVRRMRGDD